MPYIHTTIQSALMFCIYLSHGINYLTYMSMYSNDLPQSHGGHKLSEIVFASFAQGAN